MVTADLVVEPQVKLLIEIEHREGCIKITSGCFY